MKMIHREEIISFLKDKNKLHLVKFLEREYQGINETSLITRDIIDLFWIYYNDNDDSDLFFEWYKKLSRCCNEDNRGAVEGLVRDILEE